MPGGDFKRDDAWQREIRERILKPSFYGRHAVEGRYVFMDKGRLATLLQRRYAVDTIMQAIGCSVCIEEKIVRFPKSGRPYTAFSLETHSCTVPGRESPGWMDYGQADYLFYCFAQSIDPVQQLICYLIPFEKLKSWFWPREASFPTFGPLNTDNRSMGRVVPIDAVTDEVGPIRLYELADPAWRPKAPPQQLRLEL